MRPAAFVVLLLATAAPAQAQEVVRYGGGSLPRLPTTTIGLKTVGVAIERRGGRAAIAFDTQFRCGGGGEIYIDGRTRATLEAGRLRAEARRHVRLAARDLRLRWSVTAKLDGESASGTITIRGRRGAKRCAPVRHPFETRVIRPSSGQPASSGDERFYLGASDQRVPRRIFGTVAVRVSRGGRRIGSRWSVAARCSRGTREVLTNFTPASAIRSDGTFARRERFTVRFQGMTVRYRVSFAGRFLSDGARGTLRMRARRVRPRTGHVLATCDSGTRSWTALPAI